ncbi:hypothetical protein L345_13371 [Ophiophagus hannah]|uniref:Uncharacterized protein n=1 Tax=Ophiophagus hannah TaxID=8665 RepID=V8NF42_OPHHA|nr:hypothetical protein L345_13371 [Ophiophagus hannah]
MIKMIKTSILAYTCSN